MLFLLPVPLLYRACCHISACLLTCVSLTSYLSDHVYTGLESYAHAIDKSLAALKCHVWANYYARRDMYDQFVIWHCLWHAVGVGSMLICYTVNGPIVGECWSGTEWEDHAFVFSNYFTWREARA
ncbi:hypothetical protein ACHAXA_007532 [Cyclostephanos tholiformis]|uniref:Innexin n=1 Tax=Cyclostephanos tholiformis TaxID=382380 RepID=A0ABD3SRF9_9STRA